MNQRTRDILILGLFAIVIGNSVVGWLRGSIDLTMVTLSMIGLIGALTGIKPWSKNDKDDDKEDR